MPDYQLGRHHEFDERSRQYPVRELLPPAAVAAASSIHRCYAHLDQGQLGSCVGNGWTHARATTPHGTTGLTEKDALLLYERATVIDTIQGAYPPDDTGSSVLAGAKVCKSSGWFAGYRWAFTIADVVDTLLHLGPVVVGTDWTDDMFTPDPATAFVSPTGSVAGGHCYLLRGVTLGGKVNGHGPIDYLTCRNSWGTDWGHGGDFHITVDDMASLLKQDGEAAVPHH